MLSVYIVQVFPYSFTSMDTHLGLVEKREKKLQSRRERESARHASKTAEQREERLRKWRMTDRARRASKARQARLQQTRYGLGQKG